MSRQGGLRTSGVYKRSYAGKPLISIVTVVKNAKIELVRTLKSVIRQTYDNIEYIVIDGASSDGTVDVIKAFEGSIDYWCSEKDRGVYHGMNKAIDLVTGDWVNFMNAGDWFSQPDIVERIFERYPGDAECIYGDFYFLFKRNQLVPVKAKPLDTLWQEMAFSHQSLFVKTDVLKKYKFNLRCKVTSDYHLIFQLVKNNHPFHYVNKFIAFYSYGGLSINKQVKSLVECWRIARKFEKNENFKVDRYYIPIIWERIKIRAREKWQVFFGKSNQSQQHKEDPQLVQNILAREPFLIDYSYFKKEGITSFSSGKPPVIHSLLQWILYPPFKFDDVEYNGNMVKAGKLVTDASAQVFTEFLEIEDHTDCYRVECFIKDDSLQGSRVFQLRCYDEKKTNIKILRFTHDKNKQLCRLSPGLAHNFFLGQTGNSWKKVGGYILGSHTNEDSYQEFLKHEDEIITKLPVEAKYFKICFVNYKNDGIKTKAWFYSPVLEKFKIQ
jgi:glycosyltransferase involved in cell wall biosynthesis